MSHPSSTIEIPAARDVPRHVAIILDGNGRWAKRRRLPRFAGHRRGVEAVRAIVAACAQRGVGFLTLFAFSSENWRRPAEEVALLMQLFVGALENEVQKLHRNGIRLKVIGERRAFDPKIQSLIAEGERLTEGNSGLTLTIAANYGGRWDILQALTRLAAERPQLLAAGVTEQALAPYLAISHAPEPDLFIRTGGEQRVSNFLLWQLAYAELYFTNTLWPDFGAAALDAAFAWYQMRERRYGRTSEQLTENQRAGARGEPPTASSSA
jgi:undecaprenyl diphosphate synthase